MTPQDADARDRREMLGLVAMAGSMFTAAPAMAATKIDFADPTQRLDAFIKVEGDTAGTEVVQYGAGSIYTFIEGQVDRKLFDTEAFAVRRYRRVEGGWVRLHREVAVYRDATTGKIINSWYNPYLERDVEVMDIVQEFNRQYLVEDLGKTFDISVKTHGDDAFFARNFFISREAEIQPKDYPLHGQDTRWELSEYHNYFCKLADLTNEKLTSVRCVGATNSVSSFLPWLQMGNVPGHLIFQMRSAKLARVTDMPKDLVDYVAKNYPTHLMAPEAFKPNDAHTTGLNFYKQIIDKGRGQGR
jgi:Protein of unknown function (DUF1838)